MKFPMRIYVKEFRPCDYGPDYFWKSLCMAITYLAHHAAKLS